MHTVELLECALREAKRLGYGVRHEWLGGNGGGACVLKGRMLIFLDLAQPPVEQLALVADVIRGEVAAGQLDGPLELRSYLLAGTTADAA